MKRRLVIVLLALIGLPLGGLAWLGQRFMQAEAGRLERELSEVLRGKLRDTDAAIARALGERERELMALTEAFPIDAEAIRDLMRRQPRYRHVLVMDARGRVVFPPLDGAMSVAEREFLERTRFVWEGHDYMRRGGGDDPRDAASLPGSGWYPWFWGGGLNLLYFRPLEGGRVVAVELGRVRLLSDIVAFLPGTDPDAPARERIALRDADGDVVYQWGGLQPVAGDAARVTLPLGAPLSAWSLAYYAAPGAVTAPLAARLGFNWFTGLLALALALVGLAVYFYRESDRDMRNAVQRVTFVNQVSHELRTPLTNIRMYAELLADELDDAEPRTARYLDIIVSESQRLSRLIGNILTFARQQRRQLALHPTPGRVDDVVHAVCEQFAPALAAAGVTAHVDADAGDEVELDGDALEQILNNLLTNVIKYAASGGRVDVTTRQAGPTATVVVADRGPGVPGGARERVFQPFFRASDKLTDGATGTGIGLTIARELARLHGGDLTLRQSDVGARFELTLRAPPTSGETT